MEFYEIERSMLEPRPSDDVQAESEELLGDLSLMGNLEKYVGYATYDRFKEAKHKINSTEPVREEEEALQREYSEAYLRLAEVLARRLETSREAGQSGIDVDNNREKADQARMKIAESYEDKGEMVAYAARHTFPKIIEHSRHTWAEPVEPTYVSRQRPIEEILVARRGLSGLYRIPRGW
jgi:hypothetical protein